jgi:hypothetical protein
MSEHESTPGAASRPPQGKGQKRSSPWSAWLVLVVCAAPVIASYAVFYLAKPEGRTTNYGTFLPVKALYDKKGDDPALATLDGKPRKLSDYKGQWLMLSIDSGKCAEPCVQKLYKMRQVRESTGKERDRSDTVWLITDNEPIDTMLIRAYDGTEMLRAADSPLLKHFVAAQGQAANEHIYVIDAFGNLMMRWPKDADPVRMRKDFGKLLYANRAK